MSHENPLWGAPRIQSEFRRLGFEVAELSTTSILGEELAGSTRNRSSSNGQGHRHPTSRRPASSVSAGRIMSMIAACPCGDSRRIA
jgi:hypothetical protein